MKVHWGPAPKRGNRFSGSVALIICMIRFPPAFFKYNMLPNHRDRWRVGLTRSFFFSINDLMNRMRNQICEHGTEEMGELQTWSLDTCLFRFQCQISIYVCNSIGNLLCPNVLLEVLAIISFVDLSSSSCLSWQQKITKGDPNPSRVVDF